MKRFLYKWLPIIFGCHCRSDRSFYWHGEKFPICARCTGELAGIIAGVCTCLFFRIPLWAMVLLMVPMILDGFIQLLTSYESTNIRRAITGFLFGFGLTCFFIASVGYVYHQGVQTGKNLIRR